MAQTITMTAMGAKGDGIAEIDGVRLHIPYALPGESVEVERDFDRATLLSVITPSVDRVVPLCPHFGVCGGCSVQHWAEPAVAAWKRERIIHALSRVGITTDVRPTLAAHGAGRRRVTLHVRKIDDGQRDPSKDARFEAGFMRAKSHEVINLDTCPLLVPELADAPEIARDIGHILRGIGKPLDVQVTATDPGLDVDFRGAGPLPEALKLKLIAYAAAKNLARLTVHGARLVEARPPSLSMGTDGLTAYLPPGSFLQATAEAEETLARLALEALKGTKNVADLFCGLGPFALRLARHMKVTAYDSDKSAIEMLQRSIRANPGGKPLVAEARDLFRRPLFQPDLKPFDAVLLDPPRQGAESQCREIAKSKLARVVYISCDPESFARDAKILVGAGFKLGRITPVDQFRFSSHVELVAEFSR